MGDFLIIKKIHFENLNRGDVIAYNKSKGNSVDFQVVHRITKILKDHIITRGDNNKRTDINPVTKSNLIGKVEKFERNGKTYRVTGGIQGLFIARSKYYLRAFLLGIYKKTIKNRMIKKAGTIILRSFTPKIRLVKLASPEGPITKWLLRGKVIAQRGPEKDYFYCQKPFELIIKK